MAAVVSTLLRGFAAVIVVCVVVALVWTGYVNRVAMADMVAPIVALLPGSDTAAEPAAPAIAMQPAPSGDAAPAPESGGDTNTGDPNTPASQ